MAVQRKEFLKSFKGPVALVLYSRVRPRLIHYSSLK
jgi:hypothetical protein